MLVPSPSSQKCLFVSLESWFNDYVVRSASWKSFSLRKDSVSTLPPPRYRTGKLSFLNNSCDVLFAKMTYGSSFEWYLNYFLRSWRCASNESMVLFTPSVSNCGSWGSLTYASIYLAYSEWLGISSTSMTLNGRLINVAWKKLRSAEIFLLRRNSSISLRE